MTFSAAVMTLLTAANATYELSLWGLPAGSAIIASSSDSNERVSVSMYVRLPLKVTSAHTLVTLRDGAVVSGEFSSDSTQERQVTRYQVEGERSVLRRSADHSDERVAAPLVDVLGLLFTTSRDRATWSGVRQQWVWTGRRLSELTLEARSPGKLVVRQHEVERVVLEFDDDGFFPSRITLDEHLVAVRTSRGAGPVVSSASQPETARR